jgi:hypothetical protein
MEAADFSETLIPFTKLHDVTSQEIEIIYVTIMIVLAQLTDFIEPSPS